MVRKDPVPAKLRIAMLDLQDMFQPKMCVFQQHGTLLIQKRVNFDVGFRRREAQQRTRRTAPRAQRDPNPPVPKNQGPWGPKTSNPRHNFCGGILWHLLELQAMPEKENRK